MKKILTAGIVLALAISVGGVLKANAYTSTVTNGNTTVTTVSTDNYQIATKPVYQNNAAIKAAIAKYKANNFVGCISDLRMYTEKDPNSAIAWYYLGSSYMKIAMQQDANAAFDRVIALNTVPKLTSYAIQAQLCMQNQANCKYKDFTYEEIKALKANPTEFLQAYSARQNVQQKDQQTEEIERLIKGGYPYNIHPKAKQFIDQEKTKIKQTQINENG